MLSVITFVLRSTTDSKVQQSERIFSPDDDFFISLLGDIEDLRDTFSASWLMNKKSFEITDTKGIGIIEDGALDPIRKHRERVRMTRNFFDFSVEHLSKWWKELHLYTYEKSFNHAMDIFEVINYAVISNYFFSFFRML